MIHKYRVNGFLLGLLVLGFGSVVMGTDKAPQPTISACIERYQTADTVTQSHFLENIQRYAQDAQSFLQGVKGTSEADKACLASAGRALAEFDALVKAKDNEPELRAYLQYPSSILNVFHSYPKEVKVFVSKIDEYQRDFLNPARQVCAGTTAHVQEATAAIGSAFRDYLSTALDGKPLVTAITPQQPPVVKPDEVVNKPAAALESDSLVVTPPSIQLSEKSELPAKDTIPTQSVTSIPLVAPASSTPLYVSNSHLGLIVATPLAAVLVGAGLVVYLIKHKMLGKEDDKIVVLVNKLTQTVGAKVKRIWSKQQVPAAS